MSLVLFHGQPNGPSLTALASAFEKGVDVELRQIDLAGGERHSLDCKSVAEVAMSIEGEGPVLIADGRVMSDAFFIGLYFDETETGPALRPADPYARWQVMMWCRYVTERVAPAAALLGTRAYLSPHLAAAGDEFEELLARIECEDLAQRWRDVRTDHFPEDKLADSHAKIAQAVGKLETALVGQDWIFGGFTIADIETYAWLASMPLLTPAPFEKAPSTMAWLDRVAARPSVQRALACASVGDPRQHWAVGPEINRWG
jgi:GST-like protein